MAFCVNCGAWVYKNDKICKECGCDPNVKGKRLAGSKEGIGEYMEGTKAIEGVSEKKDIHCPNCGKVYKKSLLLCPSCNEKNPYEDFPLKNYIINTFTAYGAIICVILACASILFLVSISLVLRIWLTGLIYLIILAVSVPLGGTITYLSYILGRNIRRKIFIKR